jgi:hypothetical protein
MPRWRSTLWALGPDGPRDLGTSRLELRCHPLPLEDRGACHIFDATRTRFFAVDASTDAFTPVGSLPGRFYAGEEPQGDWITGWYQSGLIAVSLDSVEAIRVAGPNESRPHILAVSDQAAAGVWYESPATSSVRIDPTEEAFGASVIRIYRID